ncbi:MAG: response regulator transcription factor [Chloroflexi bacterium]|nr:response regulator transcription factor [Chloroflexota bacterium]OJV90060.1 MAG: DNA-binding response regulator [Chloroflexi bacterium 54-19]
MRILIVEDEIKLARLVKEVLEEELYQVELAFEGETGLDMALSGSFDLLILDIMLPGMSGLEICQELRQEKCNVPVLILTARDAVPDRVEGLDAGADDYLTKPFSFEELLARVRALSRRRLHAEDVGNPVLKLADLEVNLETHRVRRGGKLIDLTAKEYFLLEYLIRNAGRVLNRDQIISKVWKYDFDASSNVVDIYIHYLRNKIDGNSSTKLIQTLRGTGYSLRVD